MAIMNIIKGALIGIALVIPGLSASIFAVAVGLYEKILDAVNNLRSDKKGSFKFLLPIVIGVMVGVLVSTELILWVIERFPLQSYILFTGLVLGSVPMIIKKIKFKPLYLIFTVVAFFGMIYMIRASGVDDESYVYLERISSIRDVGTMFFSGLFAASLMATPGVSGSVMLMIINQYETVYNAVSNAMRFSLDSIILLIPFTLGAILGVIAIARVLAWLLKRFADAVYYSVLGLLGSAVFILLQTGFEEVDFDGLTGAGTVSLVLICIVCLVIGFLSTVFFNAKE
ncbi:MAG: DUF368 domain-containing protein [Defluviitaleaceae bacterium]|nr:DUF368 domain-containing protein [Defluviitaleaceae bacterium]